MERERQSEPTCPRCGYDLRGTVATWGDAGSCPLDGTCQECGLSFQWPEVFAAARGRPLWCVEFALRSRFAGACAATLARTLHPWRLWSQIRMEHTIRWPRIVAYVLAVCVLPLLFIYVALQTSVAVYVRYQQEAANVQFQARMTQTLTRLESNPPDDPRLVDQHEREVARLRQFTAMPETIRFSYGEAIAEAVLSPARPVSRGVVIGWFGVWPYTPPRELHNYAGRALAAPMPQGAPFQRWVSTRSAADPPLMLLGGIGVLLLVPLSMTLLPISRRNARVRWRHIARVAAYSAALPTIIIVSVIALLALTLTWPARTGLLAWPLLGLAQFGLPVAAFLWWGAAMSRYLRMPHGWLIALTLTAMCTLLTGFVIHLIDEDFIVRAFL